MLHLNPLKYTILLLAFGIFFSPLVSFAYTVTPLVIDHNLQKRDIVTDTITLTNNSDNIVRVYPTVNEISVSDGGTIQNFVEPSMVPNTATEITAWLEIARSRIELQPHSTKEIPLTIRMNPQVQAGEYHAFVGFASASNQPEAQKAVFSGPVPGVMIRIGVDQEQNQFLRLDRFTIDQFVRSNTQGQIHYTLSNPGQDPVIPKGEIIFYNNRGDEVASTSVNADGKSIDGGTDLSFVQNVPASLSLGKYKAFLSVEYGSSQTESVHDTAFFYVVPLKQLLIIFAIVLFIAIAVALYVHRQFDMGVEDDGSVDLPMYIRQTRSEGKDHDIDLSKNNKQ